MRSKMKQIKNFIILIVILSCSVFTISCDAENHTKSNHHNTANIDLPATAQNFIKQHFPNNKITYVHRDDDREYKVQLDNNIKIDFEKDGTWDSVEGHIDLPASLVALLPDKAKDYINQKYSGAMIIEIDNGSRTWDDWDVKIKTKDAVYRDLEFNKSGKNTEDKHDD